MQVTSLYEVDGYAFHASKHFLIKNDYFNALINGFFIESDQSKSIDNPISLKDVNPETFYEILQWLYTCDIPMIWRPSTLFELYRAADYFLMPDLCDAIIKFVTATFCEHNFGQVYEFALKIGNKELVFKKWKENREKFEATDQLKELVKRNDDYDFFVHFQLKMQGVDS